MKNLAPAALVFLLLSCSGKGQNQIALKELGDLGLKEVSGLEYLPGSGLWGLEDSGNKNKLYRFDETGQVQQKLTIADTKNTDWESLAADKQGNLYIGDFGNNKNERKDLAIYKIDAAGLREKKVKPSETITFYYPEQKTFPPKKREMFFDCEAFFEHNGDFYLFTKNRSAGFDGTFYVYKVPNKAGNHAAQLLGTMKTCGIFSKCAITGADISPDGTKAVLLSGDKLWLITNFANGNFANGDMKMLPLNHHSQKEGVCFKDNDTLFIADEKDKNIGGKLYQVKLSDL